MDGMGGALVGGGNGGQWLVTEIRIYQRKQASEGSFRSVCACVFFFSPKSKIKNRLADRELP